MVDVPRCIVGNFYSIDDAIVAIYIDQFEVVQTRWEPLQQCAAIPSVEHTGTELIPAPEIVS